MGNIKTHFGKFNFIYWNLVILAFGKFCLKLIRLADLYDGDTIPSTDLCLPMLATE